MRRIDEISMFLLLFAGCFFALAGVMVFIAYHLGEPAKWIPAKIFGLGGIICVILALFARVRYAEKNELLQKLQDLLGRHP